MTCNTYSMIMDRRAVGGSALEQSWMLGSLLYGTQYRERCVVVVVIVALSANRMCCLLRCLGVLSVGAGVSTSGFSWLCVCVADGEQRAARPLGLHV